MAFVPNTAAPAPIILHHTPSDTATPALLYPGEAAVCHGPTHTKMWIGDGVTNRLFISTNPADSPLLNQSVLGGPFLPLTGGTLASPGNLTLDGGTLTVSRTSDAPSNAPVIALSRSRATSVPVEDGDILGRLSYIGRFGTAADDLSVGAMIDVRVHTADWSSTLRRTSMYFSTVQFNNIVPTTAMFIDYDGSLVVPARIGTAQLDASVSLSGNILTVTGWADIRGDATIRNAVTPTRGGRINLLRVAPVDVASVELGSITANGIPVGEIVSWPGAEIRFNSTSAWAETPTRQLGAEINFFVSRNDEPAPYRAMTLGEDANLTVVGTVTASGTLLTSDPALKDNIAQAPSGALAKVCELPVIDYRWKHGRDSKLHRGFSADDVKRVMGEDSGCSAEGAYSLADMNAMLWKAVQELSAEVQELKQQRVIH